jgi:hypothetical protein
MLGRVDQLNDTLDICLERLRGGESVARCLRDYPQLADELAPLLIVSEQARRAPRPQLNPAARQAVQRQLRNAVAGGAARRRATTPWYRMPVLRFAVAMLVVVLALGRGVAAAQYSLPGSPLYPVKRAGEDLRLSLAFKPDQRAALHMDFAQTRLAETLALLDSQRPADERVLDDLAREYELAWANIELLPAGNAQAQRARYITESQAEVAALAEALERAPQTDRQSIDAALRSGRASLSRASKTAPFPPTPSPAQDPHPTPASPQHDNTGQGNGRGQGNGQGNGQGQNNGGTSHPGDQGNGQGNGQNNSTPGGNGQGNDKPGGNGQGNDKPGGNSQGNDKPGGNSQGNDKPGDNGQGNDKPGGNSQDNTTPGGNGQDNATPGGNGQSNDPKAGHH